MTDLLAFRRWRMFSTPSARKIALLDIRHVFPPPLNSGHSPLYRDPAINQCVHKTACRHPLRVEVMTELRPREDAAVKADQGDPFRVLAGPSERFQLAISSPQVLDHLLISVLVLYKKTMDFLQ